MALNPNDNSAQPCGCDPGMSWVCEYHMRLSNGIGSTVTIPRSNLPTGLPVDAAARKALPLFTGFLMYFPDAWAAVAEVSRLGNDQHNPGQPLHWARGKSTDHMDSAIRHAMDHGRGNYRDTDGAWHLAKGIWRFGAELQLTIEKERK